MAAAFQPQNFNFGNTPLLFDVSRQTPLGYHLDDIRLGQQLTAGSTHSTLRVRPSEILEWANFPQEVALYWNQTVPPDDKVALIHSQQSTITTFNALRHFVVTTENDIKFALNAAPFSIHRVATRSDNGQPIPTDAHSEILQYQAGGMGLFGEPDYYFKDTTGQRVTAVMDAKTPWEVTPQQILAVLNGMSCITLTDL
jgi:hypothetical protein